MRSPRSLTTLRPSLFSSLLLGAITFALPVAAATLSLATAPMATSTTTSVKPNLLFILDNSGSMDQDYTPDSVTSNNCYNYSGGFTSCGIGDPPYMSSDFNKQYYNPAVTYTPGVNSDGTSRTAQTSGNTSTWTSVTSDSYGKHTYDQRGNYATTVNIVSNYPDRAWCSDAGLTTCVTNNGYSYPNSIYRYSKNVTGAPYYYTIGVGEYCSDANLTTCIASNTASGSYVYPARVRWCNSASLTNCQSKRLGNYTYPRYSTTTLSGTYASGSFSFASTGYSNTVSVSQVAVGGVNLMSSSTSAAGNAPNTLASNVASAIASNSGTSGYTASASGSTVTITPTTTGTGANGAIAVTTPSTGSSAASATVSVSSAASSSSISQLVVNGVSLICATASPKPASAGTSSNATTRKNQLASQLAASIQSCSASTGFSTSYSSGSSFTLTAPASAGASPNGAWTGTFTTSGTISASVGSFSGGVPSTSAQVTIVSNVTGGAPASSTFTRVNIVPAVSTYAKASTRTDCAGASTCTYAEEMTNFANWYTFYRTRMQMMKSSAGRAFTNIGSNFRVGFITINSSTSNYIKINDFTTSQKNSWYSQFYGITPGNSTPLRSTLAKAGRIFAGKNPYGVSGGDDPMQYSCQQNFALLTTDGYWNQDSESAVVKIDGSTQINNQDNDINTMARPMFDGNGSALSCPSGASCLGASAAGSVSGSSYSSVNTLADVAAYYYNTDLRTSALGNCTSPSTGLDVCSNDVPGSGNDVNSQQHMTTFTLGLADGSLTYQADYATANSGDFYQIKQGTKDWPQVLHDDPTAIDDLWHAAVNGRGQYFFAQDPNALSTGLNTALAGVSARLGAGAAAATSNLDPVQGDNFAYVASYTSVYWYGNLESRTIDTQTGVVGAQANWCVEDVQADAATGATACTGQLKSQAGASTDTRAIYTWSSGSGNHLRSFAWGNLTATEQGYFNTNQLSQYSTWSATDKSTATGSTLIGFLRGQYGYENQTGATAQLYRDRSRILGDVVGSQPVYVKKPYFTYTDSGYSSFVTSNASRAATVFIGGNDGMLHAFNAATGQERWAYIPSAMLPNLYLLADANYSNLHRYFVDGPITIADVCTSGCGGGSPTWKTILVGAFNGGGRGYYALDITDPTSPSALWEATTSTDNDFGYSFGNPVVTKDNTGKWVVLVSSGYNNVSPGTGLGKLFVLDAATGSVIRSISTGAGNTTTPSGLAKLAAWVDNPATDNSASYIYGGDLLGNLWRFDFNAGTVVKVAALTDGSGNAQPITTRPELANISGTRMLYAATGKYLELTDLSTTSRQSIYGIKDTYDTDGTLTSPHSVLKQQTLTNGTNASGAAIRTGSNNAVNLATDRGWYIDLPDTGERNNIDMQLVSGTLVVPSNVPTSNVCNAGGYSWLNYIDYKTGAYQSTAPNGMAGTKAGNALIVGVVVIKLASGFVVNATLSDNPTPVKLANVSVGGNSGGVTGKRTTWRELTQ